MENKKARVIAYYLPQYHPVTENDDWWGKGFTEWTNVGSAKPLYKGHYQPRVPADLGYYDLRFPEVREMQADMARDAGIEGFCYWHYWFGNGRQILERPFNEVLASGKPDFPFCLGWANHSWTNKSWKKNCKINKESTLIEQTYQGKKDYEMHFYYALKAFQDKRYLCIDGQPIFVIYDPYDIPDPSLFIDCWNELANKNGLNGIHFIGIVSSLATFYIDKNKKKIYYIPSKKETAEYRYRQVLDMGFNAINSRGLYRAELIVKGRYVKVIHNSLKRLFGGNIIDRCEYKEIIKHLFVKEDEWEDVYPTIIPNWDRSPRSGKMATIYHGSTPELFGKHLEDALHVLDNKKTDRNILFLMSWNEWAEGNYVEPDVVFGTGYLEQIKLKLINKR